jgi:tetratricopeptide (TPR) repeat protein
MKKNLMTSHLLAQLTLRDLPFAQLVRSHPGLVAARRHYADKSPAARRALALEPSSAVRLNDLGWALLEAQSYPEARSVLEQAVALAPADYDLPRANLRQLEERSEQKIEPRKRRT